MSTRTAILSALFGLALIGLFTGFIFHLERLAKSQRTMANPYQPHGPIQFGAKPGAK